MNISGGHFACKLDIGRLGEIVSPRFLLVILLFLCQSLLCVSPVSFYSIVRFPIYLLHIDILILLHELEPLLIFALLMLHQRGPIFGFLLGDLGFLHFLEGVMVQFLDPLLILVKLFLAGRQVVTE